MGVDSPKNSESFCPRLLKVLIVSYFSNGKNFHLLLEKGQGSPLHPSS